MVRTYFSDRDKGARARTNEKINFTAWEAIQALIITLMDQGAFGYQFPVHCPNKRGIIGTNKQTFIASMNGVIPDLNWPLGYDEMPTTLTTLDVIEFCHSVVARPIEEEPHDYYGHFHLSFEEVNGQEDFRNAVNQIFARNGLVYEIKENGYVERMGPPVLREALNAATFSTGDAKLDELLETARAKYHSPDIVVRRESLEKLWDAWERLKTVEAPNDKRVSIEALIAKATPTPHLRKKLNDEAQALTDIGNEFMIRHTEIMAEARDKTKVTREQIADSALVDYFFQRLYAMIHLILASRGAV